MTKQHKKCVLRKRIEALGKERNEWIRLSGTGWHPSIDVIDAELYELVTIVRNL